MISPGRLPVALMLLTLSPPSCDSCPNVQEETKLVLLSRWDTQLRPDWFDLLIPRGEHGWRSRILGGKLIWLFTHAAILSINHRGVIFLASSRSLWKGFAHDWNICLADFFLHVVELYATFHYESRCRGATGRFKCSQLWPFHHNHPDRACCCMSNLIPQPQLKLTACRDWMKP